MDIGGKISPKDLVGYAVLPPLPTQSEEELMIPETPAPDDGLINADKDEQISEVSDEGLEVDHEDDRDYHHELV